MSDTSAPRGASEPIPGPLRNRLRDKVALVTGGGATNDTAGVGTGVAICRLFAADGCRVVVANRSIDAAERTSAAIAADGGDAITIQTNVAVATDCSHAVDMALTTYGRLDILVNNAGVNGAEDDWDEMMTVNVKGMALMAHAAVPFLPRGGAIVNIASIAALQPGGSLGYATSKGAVVTLTKAMAVRWGFRGIRSQRRRPWKPLVAGRSA